MDHEDEGDEDREPEEEEKEPLHNSPLESNSIVSNVHVCERECGGVCVRSCKQVSFLYVCIYIKRNVCVRV